ncbi:MAG: hypothetical protein KA444_02285 [Bacteroidia bacterium]|nr:hypothetical protein [Bacteroidia bacterium]
MKNKSITAIKGLLVITFLLHLGSCKKEAGEGGTSTISGKVTVFNYDNNAFQCCPDTFAARDQDVFIIYGGEGAAYDDDVKTTFDGTYEFKYLQKGKYRIFAYTEDSTGAYNGTAGTQYRPDLPVFVEVEITGKNQTIVGPEIFILQTEN